MELHRRVRLGNLVIDPENYEVWIGERPIALSFLEFELLMQFANNPGRLLSRERLLSTVWNDTSEGSGQKLSVQIHRLRKKLEGSHPWSIESVRQWGYILQAPSEAGGEAGQRPLSGTHPSCAPDPGLFTPRRRSSLT